MSLFAIIKDNSLYDLHIYWLAIHSKLNKTYIV